MNKPELIAAISDKAGIDSSKAKAALNAFTAVEIRLGWQNG